MKLAVHDFHVGAQDAVAADLYKIDRLDGAAGPNDYTVANPDDTAAAGVQLDRVRFAFEHNFPPQYDRATTVDPQSAQHATSAANTLAPPELQTVP